jgi:hypothetical protein
MRALSNVLCCAALILGTVLTTLAQSQTKDAPIPSQIVNAKKVFISNAGADADVITTFKRMAQSRLPYDRFYSEMKRWGRYELVSAPSEADLVSRYDFLRRFLIARATSLLIRRSTDSPSSTSRHVSHCGRWQNVYKVPSKNNGREKPD